MQNNHQNDELTALQFSLVLEFSYVTENTESKEKDPEDNDDVDIHFCLVNMNGRWHNHLGSSSCRRLKICCRCPNRCADLLAFAFR